MKSLGPPWPQTLHGSLALDFANTLDWRTRRNPVETLHEYRDLLRFSLAAGALEARAAVRLSSWSRRHPAQARRALAGAIRVREAVAAIFQAVARGRAVPGEPLVALERAWRAAHGARGLRAEARRASWGWRSAEPEPDRPAWAVALEAERLLVTAGGAPIRECAGEGCGWLFLDTSRNHSRRWCSMLSCGNRDKVRRFYRRARTRRARAKTSRARGGR
jgi:predicted RNA-binding Zn ribbon-like protein